MENINLDEQASINFMTYANAVIKSRAISSIEDNLKPVHRRILYAMYDMGLKSTKPVVKCAKVTGEVLAKYHPHG